MTQLLIDGIGNQPASWTPSFVEALSKDLANASNMTIFSGPHVTENGALIIAMTLIAESHIALHLDRASGQGWIDVFSCKAMPDVIAGLILSRLDFRVAHVTRIRRGEL